MDTPPLTTFDIRCQRVANRLGFESEYVGRVVRGEVPEDGPSAAVILHVWHWYLDRGR